MPTPGVPRVPHTASALAWRFVDRVGTEWFVYDRVRWSITATQAEFRFVPPGHRDARSRLFLRSDRVLFELRRDDPRWAGRSPFDLSDRTLSDQLFAARQSGPLFIPAAARTTVGQEMARLARECRREITARLGVPTEHVRTTENGGRDVATRAGQSRFGHHMLSLCNPLTARDARDLD